MSETEIPASTATGDDTLEAPATGRRTLQPMDPQLKCIQPGGGVVIKMELCWGHFRRFLLKTFRRGYLRRMEECRTGDVSGCPHEVLDPRDVKYYRNQIGDCWSREDDPFTWRDRIPFARAGLAELIVFSILTFGSAGLLSWLTISMTWQVWLSCLSWVMVATLVVIGLLIVWFFRDLPPDIPQELGQVVSPADGTIVLIEEIEDDEFIGGPAYVIGIFLSIFNVHINRIPVSGRVIGLRYKPGKCLNALRPESARENEHLATYIEETAKPHRPMIVRQITGALARRIVCWLRPGDELDRGQQFGMIKLGSRTELVLPREEGLKIVVQIGDKVQAGSSVLARYTEDQT